MWNFNRQSWFANKKNRKRCSEMPTYELYTIGCINPFFFLLIWISTQERSVEKSFSIPMCIRYNRCTWCHDECLNKSYKSRVRGKRHNNMEIASGKRKSCWRVKSIYDSNRTIFKTWLNQIKPHSVTNWSWTTELGYRVLSVTKPRRI